jgi:hypothetical protein
MDGISRLRHQRWEYPHLVAVQKPFCHGGQMSSRGGGQTTSISAQLAADLKIAAIAGIVGCCRICQDRAVWDHD